MVAWKRLFFSSNVVALTFTQGALNITITSFSVMSFRRSALRSVIETCNGWAKS
jgi:hypothetical protein